MNLKVSPLSCEHLTCTLYHLSNLLICCHILLELTVLNQDDSSFEVRHFPLLCHSTTIPHSPNILF